MAGKTTKEETQIKKLLKEREEVLDRLLKAKVELAKLDNELLKVGALSILLDRQQMANW